MACLVSSNSRKPAHQLCHTVQIQQYRHQPIKVSSQLEAEVVDVEASFSDLRLPQIIMLQPHRRQLTVDIKQTKLHFQTTRNISQSLMS